MGYVSKVTAGGATHLVGSTLYGTCTTAAATTEKAVVCTDFDTLITGVTIHVKFTYSNSVANPTLNVNSTGAKRIYRYGTTAPSTSATTSWNAGAVVSFTYDGSAWIMNDWINNNDNTVPSAYCSTAAATAAKTASCSNYILTTNTYLHVLVTTANTVQGTITLNVNNKGAKPIYINGAASSSSNYTLPAGSYLVYYNGTNYYFRTDGKLTGAGMVDINGNTTKFLRGDGTWQTPTDAGTVAQVNYNTNNGVKNLLKITGTSTTTNGLTFSVDTNEGTITVNGTATAATVFQVVNQNSLSLVNGTSYILSGCPSGGNYGSTYALYVANTSGSKTVEDIGSGATFTKNATSHHIIAIVIRSGVTCNNLVFQPMIRSAVISDSTFVPYAEPNYKMFSKYSVDPYGGVYAGREKAYYLTAYPESSNHTGLYQFSNSSGIYTYYWGNDMDALDGSGEGIALYMRAPDSDGDYQSCCIGIREDANFSAGDEYKGYIDIRGNYWPTGSGTSAVISEGQLCKNGSSRKYKQDINYSINKQLYHNQLMSLKPVEFKYISQPTEQQLGMIAEDVEEINPNLVNYEKNQVESYKEKDMITLLIIEAQRKEQEIQELKSELASLKDIIQNLNN